MFNFQAQVFRNFDVICMKLRSPVSGNGDRNDAQIIPFQVFFSLHIFTLTPCIKGILSTSCVIFLSAFFHALTVSLLPKNHMLFIVSKQCACSRRVRIEGHMNRFEYCHPDNNSDNDSFGSFSYLLQHNSVLIFIL
jgi:hypothetical protein